MSTNAVSANEQLSACDAALNAKIKEADLCNYGISIRDKEIDRLRTENRNLSSKGFFDNPVTMVAIGVILGVALGARVTR